MCLLLLLLWCHIQNEFSNSSIIFLSSVVSPDAFCSVWSGLLLSLVCISIYGLMIEALCMQVWVLWIQPWYHGHDHCF